MPYQYGMQNNRGLPPRAVQRAVGVSPDFPVVGGGLGGLPVRRTGPTAGQQLYTTPGTYSWVVPAGVTSASVLIVGRGGLGGPTLSVVCPCTGITCTRGGAGGGGGGLAYANNISTTPGDSITVVLGSGSNALSYFIATCNVRARNGSNGTASGSVQPGAGGQGEFPPGQIFNGGGGGTGSVGPSSGGGGGAAGYSGNGGSGSMGSSSGAAGTGGGGGGGGGGSSGTSAGGGGGVGVLGAGSNGTGGSGTGGSPGVGGSGGSNGSGTSGGAYGGGGGGANGAGGSGAIRIIWPGTTRQFPSTCTGDK